MKMIAEPFGTGAAQSARRLRRESPAPPGRPGASALPPAPARGPAPKAGGKLRPGPGRAPLRVLGVDYWRVRPSLGGDLYLTSWGLPFHAHLDPANWFAPEWFDAHRERLAGTSTIYRVATRPLAGRALDLVVRFSRVGLEVPLDTLTICRHPHAEFNSPFEEFALLTELRNSRGRTRPGRLLTKKPLAIYVPPGRFELWQTGRQEHKIAAKQARHPGLKIDPRRQYILLYGWIDGQNAVQTAAALQLQGPSRDRLLTRVTRLAIAELEDHGFRMLDIKPEHVLLRLRPDGTLLLRPDGQPAYALVDYELLERIA